MTRGRDSSLSIASRIEHRLTRNDSYPQILRKSLRKTDDRVLQSWYKRTLRTLCTRERRAQKAFQMNVLTLHSSLVVCDICQLVHRFCERATNCRTTKNKHELVAPNIRRTVFGVRNCIQIL